MGMVGSVPKKQVRTVGKVLGTVNKALTCYCRSLPLGYHQNYRAPVSLPSNYGLLSDGPYVAAHASYVGDCINCCKWRLRIPTFPPSKMGNTIALFNNSAKGWSTSYAVLSSPY